VSHELEADGVGHVSCFGLSVDSVPLGGSATCIFASEIGNWLRFASIGWACVSVLFGLWGSLSSL
jgi:hypothetical protein